MQKSKRKNIKFRLQFLKFEKKKKIFNFIQKNEDLSFLNKYYIWGSKFKFYSSKSSSISLIKNYCLITGRSRGVLSKFKISRHEFRRLVNKGLVFGFRRI